MEHFDLITRASGALSRLCEVGRKISAANANKLRAAMQEIGDLLAQITTEEMGEAAPLEGDCVPLVEAGATASLKIIQPGWGSSGYYSESVLRSAASEFKRGTKMFWNHQTAQEEASRPEGSLDHLAAELTEDASWRDDGASGPGLYATAKVFDSYKEHVKDLAPHIGVSIRASGYVKQGEAEGRKGNIIERITSAKSVDFVTVPGAGGKVLSLFEAAGRGPGQPKPKEKDDMTAEEIKTLVESAVAAAVKPFQEAAAVTKIETARLQEGLVLRDAKDFAVAKLKAITLPEATRVRLAEQLSVAAPVKDGKLDTAAFDAQITETAKAEATYLSSVTGNGAIKGMGAAPETKIAEVKHEDLVRSFVALGMTEAAAKFAATGRTEVN